MPIIAFFFFLVTLTRGTVCLNGVKVRLSNLRTLFQLSGTVVVASCSGPVLHSGWNNEEGLPSNYLTSLHIISWMIETWTQLGFLTGQDCFGNLLNLWIRFH